MGDVYVDDMMLATLISMGFDEPISRQALAVSGNSSVDTALGTLPLPRKTSLCRLILAHLRIPFRTHIERLVG